MNVEIKEVGTISDANLKFAVIGARYKDKWVFVKHKERNTWEIPGGHREDGEVILDTAKRELYEETGASNFQIKAIGDYCVLRNNEKSSGRLFYAEINEFGDLPDLEIGEVEFFDGLPEEVTYPDIQKDLHVFLEGFVVK